MDHGDRPTGDNLQKDIFGWLSAPDPWKNHHTACESRHRGTAEWFVQGNTYSEWRTSEVPSSLLWVHGKRLLISVFCGPRDLYMFFVFAAGAGKSVFLYVKSFVSISKTYPVHQLHNHRRHPCHAASLTRVISIFLL